MLQEGNPCPLCHNLDLQHYHRDRRRDYWQCRRCQLVFVPPYQRLDQTEERAEYDLHQNSLQDEGYRRFLSRLADPLCERFHTASTGLDFGCGPGPALAAMLREQGHEVWLYDFFYHPDSSVFERCFDFITATEVVEHLFEPGEELGRLWEMLLPGGVLAIMTKRVIDQEAFARWHYKNDPTHVCFFSEQSFRWLADQLDAELQVIGSDVVFLSKPTIKT